jgi:D-cysteine desulfhydrase
MSYDLALFRAFPGLRQRLPAAPCSDSLPTRVHPLERLGNTFEADLWIKRDDTTSHLYGGNKPRKLDFLLGHALARGARTVVTFGGIGTNHGLATAVFARQFGLRCILGLVPQPVTEKVRRTLLLCRAYGAELHLAPSPARLALSAMQLHAREWLRGERPHLIPPGGSSAVGALGFVNAGLELRAQIDAGEMPMPDWIVLPASTGGTLAGLALGCKLAGLRARLAGVLVNDLLPPSAGRIARLANRTLARLRRLAPGLPYVHVSPAEVTIERGFLGRGFGAPSEAARRARDALAELEGIGAETTYTGKCLAAVRTLVGRAPYRGKRVLYWHTYSSAHPETRVRLPEYRELPPELHHFFHETVEQD